jgi:hypothetical protein
MRAIRDHREAGTAQANPGPLTEEDLDTLDLETCLRLTSGHVFSCPTWLSPREFPALKKSPRRGFDIPSEYKWSFSPKDPRLARALVNRVRKRLGLPPVKKSLALQLISALAFVSAAWLPAQPLPFRHRRLTGRFVPRQFWRDEQKNHESLFKGLYVTAKQVKLLHDPDNPGELSRGWVRSCLGRQA